MNKKKKERKRRGKKRTKEIDGHFSLYICMFILKEIIRLLLYTYIYIYTHTQMKELHYKQDINK